MAVSGKLGRVAAICALVAGLTAPVTGEEPVFFRSTRLEELVERELRIPDPTPTDMLDLTELVSWYDYVDLAGLEYATNLETLSLRMCHISDLAPLAGLVNLHLLELSDNEISDLAPLAGLRSLRVLDVHHNRISDLTPLSGLTKLESLQLYNNQISDLSPLLGLTSLKFLELRENPLNEHAYCTDLQTIRDNGTVSMMYSSNPRPPAGVTASKGTLADRVRITWQAVCNGPTFSRFTRYQVSRARSRNDPPGAISDWQLSLAFDDVTAEPGAGGPFPIVDANYMGATVTFQGDEDANCVLAGLVITRGQGDRMGAVHCGAGSPTIANCLIVGNQAIGSDGCAVYCAGSRAIFANCTIADNRGAANGTGIHMSNSHVTFVNCIISGNTPSDTFSGGRHEGGSKPGMTYSDMTDAPFAPGNIEVDPLFARRGRWVNPGDPYVIVKRDTVGAVWIAGDYHLKSQAGRWDPNTQGWVKDEVTSPCIDAGDPNSPVGEEPEPNGGRVNMGAYGSTAEASKSYINLP